VKQQRNMDSRQQGWRKPWAIFLLFLVVAFHTGARAQNISTVAGNGSLGYSGDGGPAGEAILFEPVSVAFDLYGNLYFADYRNFIVRKITQNGVIYTIAGTPQVAGDTLGACAATAAVIGGPTGIAVDAAGNVYIADYDNQVVAGIGVNGYDGDGIAATQAELSFPTAVAVDKTGNLYISDNGNNVIRMVDTTGMISTYAGNGVGGYKGDGGAPTAAALYSPAGIFVDGPGNLYIADQGNNVIRIVYAGAGGIITTVAGNASLGPGFGGDGGPATNGQLNGPTDITVDAQGNLFIADYDNECIRKVNVWGGLSTVAGCDTLIGYKGDGGPATAAVLNGPIGVAFDSHGDLFIADKYNSAIREVTAESGLAIAQVTASNSRISLFPNPNVGVFTVKGFSGVSVDQKVCFEVTDILGRVVYSLDAMSQKGIINSQIMATTLPDGMYMLQVRSETEVSVLPFVVQR
jgi:sugar lactone lactonase YvrE